MIPFTEHTLFSRLIAQVGMMAIFHIPVFDTRPSVIPSDVHSRTLQKIMWIGMRSIDSDVLLCLHREILDPRACVVKMVQKVSRVNWAQWETQDPWALLEKRQKSLIIFIIHIFLQRRSLIKKTNSLFAQGKLGVPGLPGYPGRQGPKARPEQMLSLIYMCISKDDILFNLVVCFVGFRVQMASQGLSVFQGRKDERSVRGSVNIYCSQI